MIERLERLSSQLDQLLGRVEQLPDVLDQARRRHADLQKDARTAAERIKESEAEITMVALGGESEGGVSLKNETARKAEIRRHLAASVDHQQLLREHARADAIANGAALNIQRIEDDWKSLSSQIDLVTNHVDLLIAITVHLEARGTRGTQ